MEMMDSQVIFNWTFGCWVALLSLFGIKHYQRDRDSYKEILAIIASMRTTLVELREELDKLRQ